MPPATIASSSAWRPSCSWPPRSMTSPSSTKSSICRSSRRPRPRALGAPRRGLADMSNDVDRFAFPEMSDEAVMALEHFLEEFFIAFQNHYFGQMHRYYQELAQRQPD